MDNKTQIAYKSGYKYQLEDDYVCQTGIRPKDHIILQYAVLEKGGLLKIHAGYAWDGPSGPTIDTRNFMRGSLIHDVLYQLMREGWLDWREHREAADKELKKACLEDGMSRVRAAYVYWSVRKFAEPCAKASQRKAVLYAP